jgi:hypothetical protein
MPRYYTQYKTTLIQKLGRSELMRFSLLLANASLASLLGAAQPGLAENAFLGTTLSYSSVSEVSSEQSSSASSHSKSVLSPFSTDGCSMWIDGTPRQPSLWRHCCVAHDKAYWIGGTAHERRKADQALQVCVRGLAGRVMGDYMYTFVIPGGSPYWLMPYRWGYGWSYLENGMPRGYKTLSDSELAQVNALASQTEKTIADDAATHPINFKIPEHN